MKSGFLKSLLMNIFALVTMTASFAGNPVWTFSPTTTTTLSVAANTSGTILYTVTNQSNKPHTLAMQSIQGVPQITLGSGVCGNPFTLSRKGDSCTLSLQANGFQLSNAVNNGPIVCEQGSSTQCYRPSANNILNITQIAAIALPAGCVYTADNNIQCTVVDGLQTNYGFTNMSYALCRSAQCPYDGSQSTVTCSCLLVSANQGLYSASTAPNNYNTTKPTGSNNVTSTYSRVNSSGETPTVCASGPFANCYGASCTVNGSSVTCTCPVAVSTFIAPQTTCTLSGNLIWSATSVSSFSAIDDAMEFMYNNFFGGNEPQ